MARTSNPDAAARAKGADCTIKGHICCKVHQVKRSCGHVSELHYGDRRPFLKTRAFDQTVPCLDCQCMEEQGIVILNNFPVFAAA